MPRLLAKLCVMNAQQHVQIGVAAHQRGDMATAEQHYQAALQLNPAEADALHLLGLVYLHRGQAAKGVPLVQAACQLQPASALFNSSLVNCFLALNQLDDAAAVAMRLATATPPDADALNNLGAIALQRGQQAAAISWFEQTLAAQPLHINARINLAVLLLGASRVSESEQHLRQALVHAPGHPHAQAYLAKIAFMHGDTAGAHTLAALACKGAPGLAEAWVVLAGCAWRGARHVEAIECLERAIGFEPQRAYLWADVAQSQRSLNLVPEALISVRKALAANPQDNNALALRIRLEGDSCDWRKWQANLQHMRQLIASGKAGDLEPWALLSLELTPAEHLQAAQQYTTARLKTLVLEPLTLSSKSLSGRLRIGYLSADFGDHPVLRLVVQLLEKHTRSRVETIGFGTRFSPTALALRAQAAFERYVDCSQLNDTQLLRCLREHKCDVLIDLSGYTKGSRSLALASRAAPLQISWLGYPGSMGNSAFDYLIADRTLFPSDSAVTPQATEQLLILPCYQPSDCAREAAVPTSRAACGLPANAVVLCSFAQAYKLSPEAFNRWLAVLQAAPNSVLWLAEPHPQARANLLAAAAARGIAPERLVFASHTGYAQYLGRLAVADLMLDTFPYSSGATANDALWMACPIVTLTGETYASRMAASALHAAGLDELVCHSADQWLQVTLALVRDTDRRNAIKAQLADLARREAGLFDTQALCTALEDALTDAYNSTIKKGLVSV